MSISYLEHIANKFVAFNSALKSGKLIQTEVGIISDSGFDSDTYNTLSLFRVSESLAIKSIDFAKNHFEQRRFCVWTDQNAPYKGTEIDDSSSILSKKLSQMRLKQPVSDQCSVKKVVTSEDLQIFSKLLAMAFPENEGAAIIDIYQKYDITKRNNIHFYLGLWEGEAVATATLFIDNETASLWEAFTVPEYRRKGISSALIDARLKFLQQHTDAEDIYVYCSPMSRGNFERQGFDTLGNVFSYQG